MPDKIKPQSTPTDSEKGKGEKCLSCGGTSLKRYSKFTYTCTSCNAWWEIRLVAHASIDTKAELDYLRWWYVMHTPSSLNGSMPTKEKTRELWKKNTGKDVPVGYREEDEVW